MPVLNAAEYLREAMDSVLAQSLGDFELVVVDDGSTDATREILQEYRDPRIIFVQNEKTAGLSANLNRIMRIARGQYVARMDGDDICMSHRFATQVKYLEEHPDISICGTWFETGFGRKWRAVKYPTNADAIAAVLLFYSPIAHPSVMLIRSKWVECELSYDETFSAAQDYDVWVRASRKMRLGNVPEVLMRIRVHPGSTTVARASTQRRIGALIRKRQVEELGIYPDDESMMLHESLSNGRFGRGLSYVRQARRWMELLREKNDIAGLFPHGPFDYLLHEKWFKVCAYNLICGLEIWREWKSSRLHEIGNPGFFQHVRWLARSVGKRLIYSITPDPPGDMSRP